MARSGRDTPHHQGLPPSGKEAIIRRSGRTSISNALCPWQGRSGVISKPMLTRSRKARISAFRTLCALAITHGFPVHADSAPAFGCPARAVLGTFNTAGGDGGPAIQAQLFSPTGLARDSTGNTYIADTSNNRVRKVTAAGVISTIAGNGIAASSGDGGLAIQASLNVPGDVAVDRQGNVYISESGGLRVRRIAPDGTLGTFAGVGRAGFSGDGSPARAAMLNFPADLAVDS